jgi:hypothetical protein
MPQKESSSSQEKSPPQIDQTNWMSIEIVERDHYVRFVPKADMRQSAQPRSVELIVHPDAKDVVGEMRMREGSPPGHRANRDRRRVLADDVVCIVERAEVDIKVHPALLPTRAHRPTGIILRMAVILQSEKYD